MAVLKGANKTLIDSSPKEKINPGKQNSRIKIIHDTYSGPIGNGDTIVLGDKIPEGALIKGAKLKSSNGGATGILDLGCQAFSDLDGNAVAADQNGLVDQADAGGQKVMKRDGADSDLLGKVVGQGGAQIEATCTEAYAVDGDIEIFVEYSLES